MLAAPIHRHSREDEYSLVLEGRLGVFQDDEEVFAGPGELVLKPRGHWHTFWNAGPEPLRVLELITLADWRTSSAAWPNRAATTTRRPCPRSRPNTDAMWILQPPCPWSSDTNCCSESR